MHEKYSKIIKNNLVLTHTYIANIHTHTHRKIKIVIWRYAPPGVEYLRSSYDCSTNYSRKTSTQPKQKNLHTKNRKSQIRKRNTTVYCSSSVATTFQWAQSLDFLFIHSTNTYLILQTLSVTLLLPQSNTPHEDQAPWGCAARTLSGIRAVVSVLRIRIFSDHYHKDLDTHRLLPIMDLYVHGSLLPKIVRQLFSLHISYIYMEFLF